MLKSLEFRTLVKELGRIKKQFLPELSPTGSYSDRKLALTTAYRMLAHAEIEYYLEARAWRVVLNAKKAWDEVGKPSRVLIALIAFSGQLMEAPPISLTPVKANKVINPDKVKLDNKIILAVNCFKRVIEQNHGLKESNILSLFLPIGINSDDLDSVFLATMNTFGEQRGLIAHSSATFYRMLQPLDPANELNIIGQIIIGLAELDELISVLEKY
jgi:hypothetical protein